jgi:hypothetical protein
MTEADSPYRLSVWPGVRVAVPPIEVPEVHLLGDDTLVFGYPMEGMGTATLEPDFHLREFQDLDARDPQQVLTFCRRWGPVGDGECSELPSESSFRAEALEADARVPKQWRAPAGDAPWDRSLGEKLGFGFGLILGVHSVGRVAAYQAVLARAVDVWLEIVNMTPLEELEKKWRADDELLFSALEQLFPKWQSRLTAHEVTTVLSGLLNPALAPFRVHLEPRDSRELPHANVYQAACLQFTNDIVEKMPYRHCANETCGKLFSRQRGRAQSAHHRVKGVRYCSDKCARAQAQREVRRRKRKQ